MLLNGNFPLHVEKDGEDYQLYAEYRANKDNVYKWFITYVGLHGILYRNENDKLNPILKDFLAFCEKNTIIIKEEDC